MYFSYNGERTTMLNHHSKWKDKHLRNGSLTKYVANLSVFHYFIIYLSVIKVDRSYSVIDQLIVSILNQLRKGILMWKKQSVSNLQ